MQGQWSAIVAVIGLIVYGISTGEKPKEIGKIMFWTGLLTYLFLVGAKTGSIFH